MNESEGRRGVDARVVAFRALLDFAEDPDARILTKLEWRDVPPRDQRLAREIALGVVRRRDLLDHICEGFAPRGLPPRVDTRFALRIGVYQLCFLDRVPPHAAVDSTVELCEGAERGFVNAVLRRVAEHLEVVEGEVAPSAERVAVGGGRVVNLGLPLPDPETDPAGWLCVVGSMPRFLVERWLERHGRERAFALIDAANRPAGVSLRTVRVSRDELAARLAAEGVETEPDEHPRVLRWVDGSSPFAGAAFQEGIFVAQDPTAVRAAEAVDAQPGEMILDLCAAPGTKASLLAEAVVPGGTVIASDPDGRRRARIVDNVIRLRMPQIKIVEDPERGLGADRVLADVPCSNTGVLSRRVEVRHRLTPETFRSLVALQTEILEQALTLVRPSGLVVYSTCSIDDEENHDLVTAVAARCFATVVEECATWPDPPHHDGGYHARIRAPD